MLVPISVSYFMSVHFADTRTEEGRVEYLFAPWPIELLSATRPAPPQMCENGVRHLVPYAQLFKVGTAYIAALATRLIAIAALARRPKQLANPRSELPRDASP